MKQKTAEKHVLSGKAKSLTAIIICAVMLFGLIPQSVSAIAVATKELPVSGKVEQTEGFSVQAAAAEATVETKEQNDNTGTQAAAAEATVKFVELNEDGSTNEVQTNTAIPIRLLASSSSSSSPYSYGIAILPKGAGTVKEDWNKDTKILKLTAQPATGCVFTYWTEIVYDDEVGAEVEKLLEGDPYNPVLTYKVKENVNRKFVACFRKNGEYFIWNASSFSEKGSLTITPNLDSIRPGTEITIKATAKSGYEVAGIEYGYNVKDGIEGSEGTEWIKLTDNSTGTIKMPTSDIWVRGVFRSTAPHAVVLKNTDPNGTLSFSEDNYGYGKVTNNNGTLTAKVKAGTEVKIVITPKNEGSEKYQLSHIKGTPEGYSLKTNSFVMPDMDLEISAEFIKLTVYEVSLSVGPMDELGSYISAAFTPIYALNEETRVFAAGMARNFQKKPGTDEDDLNKPIYPNLLFLGWYEFEYDKNNNKVNYKLIETDQIISFVVTRSINIEARFGLGHRVYTITGMSIYPDKSYFMEGDTIRLLATPEEGKMVTGFAYLKYSDYSAFVNGDSSVIHDIDGNSFTMIGEDVILTYSTATAYDINASSNNDEWGAALGGAKYRQYANVTLTAVPKEGYEFVNWTENGTQVSTSAEYSFYATKNRDLVANFRKLVNVEAESSDETKGTVTGAGYYQPGADVTLKATPVSGNVFVNWTKNGTAVSTDAEYKFKATEDVSLVANFRALNEYAVTVQSSNSEYGTVSGGGKVTEGSSVTIKAEAKANHYFVKWTKDGKDFTTDAEYTFTPDGSVTLIAVFEKVSEFTVTAVSANTALGTASGGGKFKTGEQAKLTATPATACVFVNWTVDNKEVSTSKEYSFTVTGDITVTANFRAIENYTISVISSDNNKGSVTGGGSYKDGSPVTVKATPASGYVFVEWAENGSRVSTTAEYNFTANSNRTLTAKFDEAPHVTVKYPIWVCDIQITSDNKNNITGDGITGKVSYEGDEHGGVLTLENAVLTKTHFGRCIYVSCDFVETDEHDHPINDLSVGDVPLTIKLIGENVIDVPHKESDYDVGIRTNGSITITGPGKLTVNPLFDFIDADRGIVTDGAHIEANNHERYLIISDYGDITFKNGAEFIGGSKTVHGFLCYIGDVTVTGKSKINITAEASGFLIYEGVAKIEDESYVYLKNRSGYSAIYGKIILGDGMAITTPAGGIYDKNNLKIYDANGNKISEVVIEYAGERTVTAVSSDASLGSVSGGGKILHGKEITLTATPAADCKFINWTVDGNEVSKDAEYSFTVTGDVTVTANFKSSIYKISNEEELRAFAKAFNDGETDACAILTADIIMSDTPWTPIGKGDMKYTGTFDGDGHYIKGLHCDGVYVEGNSIRYAGLFGAIGENGTVKNVTLVNCAIITDDVQHYNSVGGIAAEIYHGAIKNCHITGTSTICAEGYAVELGGIVGYAYDSVIECCSVTGNTKIEGNVKYTGSNNSSTDAGGIIGFAGFKTTISNCYRDDTGTVRAESDDTVAAGGIVGDNYGTVLNCYNIGNVSSLNTDTLYINVGGIVGINDGDIKNCYSIGELKGLEITGERIGDIGGIVGCSYGTVSDCYYSKEVCPDFAAVNDNKNTVDENTVLGLTDKEIFNLIEERGFSKDVWVKGVRSPLLKEFGPYNTLTIHANDGTDNKKEFSFKNSTKIKDILYITFEYKDHTFTGYNTKADGSGKTYGKDEEITADTELYVQWRPDFVTVKFVNDDGTELQSGEVAYGQIPEYKGETPTKEKTAESTFTFKDWDKQIEAAASDTTYTATYTVTTNKYDIKFVDEDGTELYSDKVAYGQTPEYKGETPTKAATADKTYTFAGWSPEIKNVAGDATYTATYTGASREYTVKFVNEDGAELQSGKVAYGEKAAEPAAPVKAGSDFTGWFTDEARTQKADLSNPITGDTTFYAGFEAVVYSVQGSTSWNGDSGEPLSFSVKRNINDDGTFGLFEGIIFNGQPVSEEFYTAEKGSVKLTVKNELFETLSNGEYDLTVKFKDGEVTAKVSVTQKTVTPPTGEGNVGLWIILTAVSVSGIAVLFTIGRKKRLSVR